jgi:hypothetical protein
MKYATPKIEETSGDGHDIVSFGRRGRLSGSFGILLGGLPVLCGEFEPT